ncbi:MAG: hypothetical protein SNH27_13255 [Rikenellaceae bacterium]
MEGKFATLNEPYRGYRNIKIISKEGYKWRVEICDSGLEITIYEDEFTLND